MSHLSLHCPSSRTPTASPGTHWKAILEDNARDLTPPHTVAQSSSSTVVAEPGTCADSADKKTEQQSQSDSAGYDGGTTTDDDDDWGEWNDSAVEVLPTLCPLCEFQGNNPPAVVLHMKQVRLALKKGVSLMWVGPSSGPSACSPWKR